MNRRDPDQPGHPHSDQGIRCLLIESSPDTTECINGEQRPGYHAHVQDDLNLYFLRMLEGTFSLDAAHFR